MYKQLKENHFGVYVLIKDRKAVYVGCTSNIRVRLNDHRRTKEFDDYLILKQFPDKKDALNAENAIVTFLSVFGDESLINSKYHSYTHLMTFVK